MTAPRVRGGRVAQSSGLQTPNHPVCPSAAERARGRARRAGRDGAAATATVPPPRRAATPPVPDWARNSSPSSPARAAPRVPERAASRRSPPTRSAAAASADGRDRAECDRDREGSTPAPYVCAFLFGKPVPTFPGRTLELEVDERRDPAG